MERGFESIPIDKYMRNVGIPIIKMNTGIDRNKRTYRGDREQIRNQQPHFQKEVDRQDRWMNGIGSRIINTVEFKQLQRN